MGGYTATPLEITKYIKIPDRRFISGLLTINVVSHNDNDSHDDAEQEYYDNWASQTSALKNATPFSNLQSSDPGRSGYKHSFGDYDSLLFYVSGGMTLHPVIPVGTAKTTSYLTTMNYSDTTNGVWYEEITHPCQHFLKSHLISRINNGYGHTSGTYSKITPIKTDTFEADDLTTLTGDDTGAPTSYASSRGGQWSRHIFSTGTFSNDSDGDFIKDLSVDTNNTYFPQVEGVEIYGKHDYTMETNTGDGDNLYRYTSHQGNFWSMVIKIKMRGYDSTWTSGSPSQADTEFFKSRTNIFFQPFGETANFDIADNLHT